MSEGNSAPANVDWKPPLQRGLMNFQLQNFQLYKKSLKETKLTAWVIKCLILTVMQLFVNCFQKLISDTYKGSFCWAAFLYGHFHELTICYQRRTNDLLTRSRKTNYERTTGELTIWLKIDDCLTVTIDGSKCTNHWLRVFIANNITA